MIKGVITSWTAKQAKVVYQSMLFPKLQKDMAEELGMTRQNFNCSPTPPSTATVTSPPRNARASTPRRSMRG